MSVGVQIIQLYLRLDISNIFIMCQPICCNHNDDMQKASRGIRSITAR